MKREDLISMSLETRRRFHPSLQVAVQRFLRRVFNARRR